MDLDALGRWLSRRPLVGQLAVMKGWLTQQELADCLETQRRHRRPLAEILLERGLLTRAQLEELLQQQRLLEMQDAAGSLPFDPERVRRMVSRYALIEQLGIGGSGVVWKAWDLQLHRWVAVKEPRLDHPVSRERFLREARAAARLRHPNLIEVFEIGQHEGNDFIVMDFIEGHTLDRVRLGWSELATLMAEICEAVHYMHSCGVLHRDIKPANIIVDERGRGHLGDFGVAKTLGSHPLTVEGALVGTPQYMSPEQASGKLEAITPKTDVYGLGATLYYGLTGRAPYDGETELKALFEKIMQDRPLSPKELDPAVPRELDLIVRCATAKRPEERYKSAAEMAEDLRRYLRGEALKVRPDGILARTGKWVRRYRGLVAAVLAAMVIGSLTALLLYRSLVQRRTERYEEALWQGEEQWKKATGYTRGRPVDREALERATREAMRHFDRAARADPARPYPWLMQGRCLLLLRDGPGAEAAWSRALSIDPQFGPALFERGKYRLSQSLRLRRQPTLLLSGRQVRFGTPEAERGEEKQWRERGEQDLTAARSARGLEPTEVRYLEGLLALADGKFEAATEALSAYAQENSWDAAALRLLGAARFYAGHHKEAEESLSRSLELEPCRPAHRLRGDIRMALSRPADALQDYDAALAADPDDPGLLCNRGLALQALQRYPEAMESFTRAIERHPGFARAWMSRGVLRAELLEYAEAEADLRRATDLEDFYAEAHYNLGNVLMLKGELEQALHEYTLAIEIRGDFVDARIGRGMARLQAGQYAAAVEDFTRAVELEKDNPDCRLWRARAHAGDRNAAEALKDLQEALRLGGPDWKHRPEAERLRAELTR